MFGTTPTQAPARPPVTDELVKKAMDRVREMDFIDLLPSTLRLDNRPFDVKNARPMFAPLFRRTPVAPRQIFLCGRQVGKTASAAGYCAMNLFWREMFRILYVAPLAIYTARFHHIYMGKMVRECRLPWAVQDKDCTSNVNEKTFVTGGHFHGVSCYNSAGNAIGIPADSVVFDEVQDLNIEFMPQILEVLGTSKFGHELYFGTARGVENTIQRIFDKSTQSEFAVKCSGCNRWNIPCLSEDALGMIQPQGISCTKCGKLLDVESGQWVHAYPERLHDFVGWHVPQTIVKARVFPHERYVEKIYQRLHGIRRYSMAKFLNEIMGISVEVGSTPITPQQIRDASVLDISASKPFSSREYMMFGGGVDWGGSEITSFTVGVITGYHRSGVFHCVNAIRPTGIPDNERHHPLAKFFEENIPIKSQMGSIMADIGFVGSVQNKNLQKISSFPVGSVQYGTLKRMFTPLPNNYFIVDRTTLLYIVFSLIKDKRLLFPKDERFEMFTEDLKAMFIEETETTRGTVQKYVRYSTLADDFLHALGYSLFSCALQVGIDLADMVGLGAGGSITRDYIDMIGEEMPIARETIP